MYNPFLRRVLVPLLIITLPVSAMIAWIVYGKKANPEATSQAIPQYISFGSENWPIFRGNPELTGQAEGTLPEKLRLAWTFKTGGEILSSPVIFGDTAYVSSLDKHLYALELRTGNERWRFQADDELEASPLFFDNTIYIGSTAGSLYAIKAENGQLKWTYKEAGKIVGSVNSAQYPTTSKPRIVFGSYDNNLYCLNAADGKLIFKYPAESYINGTVAVSNGKVFFGSCDAMVYQVPLNDPNAAVKLTTESYVAANPVIWDDMLYAGNYDGNFIAADITTQKILWSYNQADDAFFSSPAVDDTVVVVGCRDNQLYCFDKANGTVRWTFSAGGNFDSSPVICGSKTVVGNDDGRLYIVDIQTGKEVFSYTLGSPIASSPALAQNHCLIGCSNGTIYAFTCPVQ